jgi:hypothetical protein
MIGYTNRCPKCGKDSHFVLEEMECDKSVVAWCKHCKDYVSLTFTLETFRRWWLRYESGEDTLKPPMSKEIMLKLANIELLMQDDPDCYLDKVEIHLKDFTDYKYTEVEDDGLSSNS